MKIKLTRIWLLPFFALAEAIFIALLWPIAFASPKIAEKLMPAQWLFPDIGWYLGGPYVERKR